VHGYSWSLISSAAFCGVLGGKEVRFCGLAAQNALRASQAVREMRVMVKALFFACKILGSCPEFSFTVCQAATHRKVDVEAFPEAPL